MKPLVLLASLSLLGATVAGQACDVTGTAFNRSGQPLQDAVVRLVDLDSPQQAVGVTGTNAAFTIGAANASGQHMRLDLLSKPTRVTGSNIPTRSIIGQSDVFACTGQTHQDVHVQID
jgi:hypothetical protein